MASYPGSSAPLALPAALRYLPGSRGATRLAWCLLVSLVATFGCRSKIEPSPPSTPKAEAHAAALTVLSRSGWTASASVTGGTNVASNAIDGNTTTRWSTGTNQVNGQWFKVDMASMRTFTEITLDTTTTATDFPRGYRVEVSNDNVNWGTPVATVAFITISFSAQVARYIRVTQTSTASNFWSIYEFNVYGTTLSRTGWIATGSSTSGSNVAANALDGSTTTRWSTSGAQTGQFFQVDMQSPQTFNQIVLDSGTTTNNFPRGYSKNGCCIARRTFEANIFNSGVYP